MDNTIVVGVGNIYANEALFATGIDPRRAAGKISKARYLEGPSAKLLKLFLPKRLLRAAPP